MNLRESVVISYLMTGWYLPRSFIELENKPVWDFLLNGFFLYSNEDIIILTYKTVVDFLHGSFAPWIT